MEGNDRDQSSPRVSSPAHADGGVPRRSAHPSAAVRAYAVVHAVGVSLLPVIVSAHLDAARCFEQAAEALATGNPEAAQERLRAGTVLMAALRQSVLPVGGRMSVELPRIYAFLEGELERASTAEETYSALILALGAMRSLGVAWQSRMAASGQG